MGKKKKNNYDPTKFTQNFGQCIGCGQVLATSQSWTRHKKACAHFQQKMNPNLYNFSLSEVRINLTNAPNVSTNVLNISMSQTNANENLSKAKEKQTKNTQLLKPIQSSTPKATIHRRVQQDKKLLQQSLKPGISSAQKQKDLFLRTSKLLESVATDDQLENFILKTKNGKPFQNLVNMMVKDFEEKEENVTKLLTLQENENLSDGFMRKLRETLCYNYDHETKKLKRVELAPGIPLPRLPSVEKIKKVKNDFDIQGVFPIKKGLFLFIFFIFFSFVINSSEKTINQIIIFLTFIYFYLLY